VDNCTATPAPPQLPAASRLDVEELRIDLERCGSYLQIRLRPADVPPGLSHGPRVALELTQAGARELGAALLRHADAMGGGHGNG
jgi:hypothetical protein